MLATLYSVVNPILEAPDEVQHFYYVRHIARTRTLAVQDPEQVALYRQEGSQPPLYYLLGAALISWVNTDDAEVTIRENPHVNLGVPQAFGNKNAVVHTRAEGFPYQGVSLAVHLLRLLSVGLGALTVWATYALGREIFPGRPAVALLAATFNAFLPQFLFIAGAVSNDIAVAATASWAVVLLVRSLRVGFEWRRSVLLGVLMGLAALSKLGGLSVVPLVGLGLMWWAWRERRWGEALKNGLIIFAVAAIAGGWWYVRNWMLYGDLLGLQTMLDVVGRRDEFKLSDLLFELEGLRLSFWGLFGWFNVLMARWAYYVYDILAVIGVIGLGAWLWREARSKTGDRRRLVLILGLVIWQVFVFVALLYWTASTTGSQGRLLFVVISAACVLWAGGILALIPRRWERGVWVGLAAIWLGLAISVPFLYIGPAYARPARSSLDVLPDTLEHLDVTFGDEMKLLGYEMPERRVRRGTPLHLTLCWQSLAEMDRDYTVFVHLFGRGDEAIGQEDTYPGRGNYPTSEWEPGGVICDEYEALIVPEAKAPAVGIVDVGVYDLDTQERLQSYDQDMRPMDRVLLAPLKVATWAPHRYEIDHPTRFELEPALSLIGYRVKEDSDETGSVLNIALYWQAHAVPAEDYTVFVHLLNGTGELVAQHDGQPVGGYYPTSYWEEGETVKDEHELSLPPGLEAGEYYLRVGMYRAGDGQRLMVRDAEGEGIGDNIPLADVPLNGP